MAKMANTSKPDFKSGFPADKLPDGGMGAGQADGEDVILARRVDGFFAVGGFCTHYHGPLADGLLVDDTVRCPCHHACFSLRTGEALRAPALDSIACWRVEKAGDRIDVREKQDQAADKSAMKPAKGPHAAKSAKSKKRPDSVVIVGGGAAGPWWEPTCGHR